MTDLTKLAARVEALTGPYDNELDVMVEIALFKPGKVYSDIRTNSAGTKVICTDPVGNSVTFWAQEWTDPNRRKDTAACLRKIGSKNDD